MLKKFGNSSDESEAVEASLREKDGVVLTTHSFNFAQAVSTLPRKFADVETRDVRTHLAGTGGRCG